MASTSPTAPRLYDPLDDIFSSEPESPIHGSSDISLDTRRLQTRHTTVGYRDGITAGKASSIQAGFDQGFALGANIGLRAGQIRGLLEAISAALDEAGPTHESVRADGLASQAADDLSPGSIFTAEFWAPDGTWTYPVVPSHESGEIIYPDVAGQHPLISKWSQIARREADRWHIDQSLPNLESSETLATQDDPPPAMSPNPDIASRDTIAW
jgi:hypothetical protein